MDNIENSLRSELERKFIPKGAIAFFILLMLLCLAIWFGIYYIMLSRS